MVVHPLHGNDIRSVCRLGTDSGTDSDEDVLLDGEWTGVERVTEDFDVGQEFGPSSTDRKREQLGHNATNVDGGVSEIEKLIEALDDSKREQLDTHVTKKDGIQQ